MFSQRPLGRRPATCSGATQPHQVDLRERESLVIGGNIIRNYDLADDGQVCKHLDVSKPFDIPPTTSPYNLTKIAAWLVKLVHKTPERQDPDIDCGPELRLR